VYQKDALRLSVFGAGHYALPYDVEDEDFSPVLGRVETTGEID
jgi:hypothetical protein